MALYYNPKAFYSFKEAFEQRIENWNFDYGMDLVLVNVVGARPHRNIDYDNAIVFKIDEFLNAKIFDSSSQLFGKIIKLIRENKVRDVREIRKVFEQDFGINWSKALILSMFPKSIGKLARTQAILYGGRALKN